MARIKSKFIRLGTGTDDLNSRGLPANFTPTNYTPDQVASEGTDKVSAHLKGIDNALGVIAPIDGDIDLTLFNGANNQSSPANVTGLNFSNAVVRSFRAQVSVSVDATSDLFEVFDLLGVQRGSDWAMSVVTPGDDSLVDFTITSAGQIQYTSGNYSGFSTLRIQFRAEVTQV